MNAPNDPAALCGSPCDPDGGEWIPAFDARQIAMTSAGANRLFAASEIIRLAEAGLIRTRALILTTETGGAKEEERDVALPSDFWQLQDGVWQTGCFSSGGEGTRSPLLGPPPPPRRSAYGVQFHGADLAQWFPARSEPAPSSPPAPAKGGGSPGKVAVWHEFWMAAMRLLDEGELDGFTSQAELRARLLADIGDGLSDESVKGPVSRIWYAFKERSA